MNDHERGIKTYMIYGVYSNMNMPTFHQYLIDSVDILSYWNHIPLLYFVKTKSSVADLTKKIKPFFGGSIFIVQEVVPGSSDGWLPTAAWEWFVSPAPDTKTPSAPKMATLDLFAALPFLDRKS